MLKNRVLILLGACFLASSAAWADDLGYIDCSDHPQNTQVLGKAGKTSDVVASLPCGERFTIVLAGTFFSRVKTKDGKVGFVYTYLISRDASATSARQAASGQVVASAQRGPAPTATATSATAVESKPATPAQPAPSQPAPAQAPASASNAAAPSAPPLEPKPATPAPPEPAPSQPAPAQAPAYVSNAPAAPTPAAEPEPAPPEPPPPAPPQPPASAPRKAGAEPFLGRPFPRVRTEPAIELFGGFAYARLVSAGSTTNMNGALGSFGWNVKSWLQVVADSSYSFVTVSGTKTVLYGNHFGPRLFHRSRFRWGVSPFVEALVGGSRVDTTVSGTYGYKTSDNTFSIKAGGGLDIKPSRHLEVRLFDVDYYRTSFTSATNPHQNNYWASAGFILRFLGGAQ